MRTDFDCLLLDRLFQPAADLVADWVSCFGLARISLAVAVMLQVVLVGAELWSARALGSGLVGASVTLLALIGAQQAWSLIARTERQAKPGVMNVRRITLRWQRVAWLGVMAWCVATAMSAGGPAGLLQCGTSLGWVGLIYFVSCTPAPPARWVASLRVFA